MFLDASVILAVMLDEAESDAALEAMAASTVVKTSPLAVFEASSRLVKSGAAYEDAFAAVLQFLADIGADLLPLGARELEIAHECAGRYHHLTGHGARLNMGDCFAYAAARSAGLKLAYKGNDFAQTDIESIRFGN